MVGVGEMIASAVVKQVTSRLIKIAGDEIALQWKFKGEVDKMVEKMKDLEAVMHDADNKVSQGGIAGEQVGRWLLKLKSVACDVEDLLDDLDTKNNEAKAFFSRDNPAYRWITRPHNLVDVRKRIEEIENEGRVFNLVPQEQVERSRKNETFASSSDRGMPTGMQGRSAEKDKLVNLILRSQANEHISIVPIVGLGGIGKTTLAQSVFADKRVDIFDIRAWVHVSEKFDLLQIMRAIIKSIDANINLNNVTLQYLQDCLQDKLADKKYLIVLDDIWEEGGDNLEKLKRMLQHGSSGSRIVVTTRNQLVVEQMKTGILAHQRIILPVQESDQINLGFLPTNDCWELIKVRAFRPDDDPTHLEKIGYEIASKCGGVPLVANAFGQVMSEDRSVKAWQDIKVKMVDVGFRGTCQNGTLESLKLSYYYMKREFKLCFVYLAAFPKGFLIDTNRLIQQWYALEYIYSEHDGERCINYLLGMSFLQISGHPTDILSPVHAKASQKLIMHDLVHDLASIIAAEEFLVLDAHVTGPRSWKNAIHCRHAELIQYQNQFNVFNCLPKKLRSLHIRDLHEWQLPPGAFSGSKYMRVLDLACAARQLSQGQFASRKIMLPRSIEKLKLLRYLDATGLPIPSLSKSACTLQNMETLIMSNCSLETLPDNICSLHKLCYLDLSGNRSLDKLPTSLGMLSKLTFLNLSGCSILQVLPKSICELACLEHLDISECCVIQNLPDKFGSLLPLIFLNMSGCFMLQQLPESIWQLTCLQHLDMSECRATQNLPYKFGSLPKLIYLNLSGCSKITKLPDNLNLESLEHLNLSNCHELEHLPKDFGNLQRLGFLSLSDCYKVSLLPESFCQLIQLKFLDLSDCHELLELPECFGHLFELDSLNLTSCCKLQALPESFCKLSKLRCLNLSYCMRLGKLPSSFGDLKLQSLDISSTVSLKALPGSIAEMTSLTRFEATEAYPDVLAHVQKIRKHLNFSGKTEHVVQEIELKGCSSIVELADLTCYELDVQQLQNVKHPEDAERAKLREKSELRQLTLRWGTQGGEGKSVLEKLIPPRTLDTFSLLGYMSKDFPKWMSDISSYLPSFIYLALCDLRTCDTLPAFGQLPNLRGISLEKVPNIRKIGKEFFGQGRTCTKLRSIQLESMENFAELWTTRSGEENEEFLIPNLHYLSVSNCPKLKFMPYPPRSMFWYLENIDEIIPEGGFGKLSSSALPFQMVINNCSFSPDSWGRLHHFSTLELFQVESCSGLRALPEDIRCFTSLKRLVLQSLKELESLPKWLGCLSSLRCVIIVDCSKLTSFPESMKNLTALKELQLQGCKGLDILPEWLGQLTSLQEFNIIDCSNLTSLPESMKDLSSLTYLYIEECQGLAMLPECLGQIISLQKLRIINCPNLTSLPESMEGLSSLSELYIKECQGLAMLPECLGQLITLQYIAIINCPNLTTLLESMKDLSSLSELYIEECQGLATLPESLGQIISLQRFDIIDCPNLTSLPESMKKLTALRVLSLKECQRLHILPEWLQELISLEELNIVDCPNLTSLPESIQNLNALKELYIWGCPILVERCQGEDAGLISHIPEVTLHYEPEE